MLKEKVHKLIDELERRQKNDYVVNQMDRIFNKNLFKKI